MPKTAQNDREKESFVENKCREKSLKIWHAHQDVHRAWSREFRLLTTDSMTAHESWAKVRIKFLEANSGSSDM